MELLIEEEEDARCRRIESLTEFDVMIQYSTLLQIFIQYKLGMLKKKNISAHNQEVMMLLLLFLPHNYYTCFGLVNIKIMH